MKKVLICTLIMLIGASSLLAGDFRYINNVTQYQDKVGRVNAAGYINRLASSIADQLAQNKDFDNLQETPIAILSIVNMENFKQTTPIAKRISENLIHEMHVRNYKIVDYKAMSQIEIDANGDYLFSRAIEDLQNQRIISYALSGTFANYKDGMAINCRIIDIQTSLVLSTAQIFIPKKVMKGMRGKKTKSSWFLQKHSKNNMADNSVIIKER